MEVTGRRVPAMALDNETMRRWAKGITSKAVQMDEEPNPDEDLGLEEEEELEEGERNALWAGELSPDEVTEEVAEEFFEWLEDHEPEIHDAIMMLAAGIAEGDVGLVEEGKESLAEAAQLLNPEYPPLTPGQKEEAEDTIAKHMREKGKPSKGSPAWKQAVAIGLSEARSGEGH